MQLTPIAANQTEIETDNARVFFSYRTPVAAYVYGEGYVRTEKWWSVTTSRHINKWIGNCTTKEVSQTYLDNLVQEVIMRLSDSFLIYIFVIFCFIIVAL